MGDMTTEEAARIKHGLEALARAAMKEGGSDNPNRGEGWRRMRDVPKVSPRKHRSKYF